jgi:hypothetical protein
MLDYKFHKPDWNSAKMTEIGTHHGTATQEGLGSLGLFDKSAEVSFRRAISSHEISTWASEFENAVTFEIGRDSGFGLFAEGIALGRLREFVKESVEIRARLRSPRDLSKCLADPRQLPEALRDLFGLQLLWSSSSVLDALDTDRTAELRHALWSFVQKNLGEYGDGKQRTLVCRDPSYPLPQCLLHGRRRRFPDRQQFRLLLQDMGRNLGGGDDFGFSTAEESLITFLYEAARNSHEHGRFDEQNQVIPGIRGITVEKIVSSSDRELHSRADIPSIVREYLSAVWGRPKSRRIVIAFTVADIGLGIQNTVPPRAHETPWERFLRAFEEGVSRKPTGAEIDRGMGLSKLIDSAVKLKAFLFVHSAGIAAYRDFFSKRSTSKDLALLPWQEKLAERCAGTSLTLLWPVRN